MNMRDVPAVLRSLRSPITGLLLALVLLPANARAQEIQYPGLDYTVSVTGAPYPELESLLKSVSDAFALNDRPPSSLYLLEHRVKRDVPKIKQALNSHGFFQAEVNAEIDDQADPPSVLFTINPGPRFILAQVALELAPAVSAPGSGLPEPGEIGLVPGEPYLAADVLKAQKQIVRILKRRGRPFPKIAHTRVVADHASQSVAVAFTVDPGPEARFGDTQITGLESVDPKFAAAQIAWQTGDLFDSSLIEATRTKLIKTGLFAGVDIALGRLDHQGRLPVNIGLTERNHRTFRTGVNFTTDEGPGFKLGWEHRNFMGAGERLESLLVVNRIRQNLRTSYRKPRFFRQDQDLVLTSALAREQTDAFSSDSFDNQAMILRRLTPQLTAGAGLGYRLSNVTKNDKDETYGLAFMPATLDFDYSDDLLDPAKGGRLSLWAAPYTDTLGNDISFFKFQSSYRHYFELVPENRLVLAGRVNWGMIGGVARSQIPGDILFYSGGGGSVRGYPYQTAGDLEGEDPTGGLGLLEVSGEIRFKLNERFGLGPFIDGGRAYGSETPALDEDLLWGAGLGCWYYTGFGPIRLDLAVPLNRREGIDDRFQIYISIGQAF